MIRRSFPAGFASVVEVRQFGDCASAGTSAGPPPYDPLLPESFVTCIFSGREEFWNSSGQTMGGGEKGVCGFSCGALGQQEGLRPGGGAGLFEVIVE